MTPGQAEGRRLTARGAATRDRIVAAAADLLGSIGAGAVGLDDVMTATGVSKSQLYHYFSDKDELLREAASVQAARVLAFHAPRLEALDSMEALRRWRDAVIAMSRHDGCPLGALVYQLPAGAKPARAVVDDGLEVWRRRLEEGLGRMRRRGALPPEADPADMALAILGAVQGGLLLSKSQGSNRPLERAFDMALTFVAAHDPGLRDGKGREPAG